MQTEVLLIERRVAPVQVRLAREAYARGRPVDPFGFSFEFKEDADGRFVDTDDARFARKCEFRSIFLISEVRLVPEAVKYLCERSSIGDTEFDFFSGFVGSAAGWSFIG